MQHIIKNISRFSCIGLLLIAAQGCSSPAETPAKESFEITDSLLKKLIIDTVQAANSRTDLMFSAKITADEERKAEIFPMVSGTVNRVPVRLGDQVSKGQVLATMGSAEMAGYDKEVISSSAELRNAERALKQAQQLFDSGMSSARELEEAKNDYLVKQAEDKRSRAILKLNGGSGNGSYTIKSPISGFIIEKNVNANMMLRPDNDNSLFTVADLSTVWAMVNIYESDISRIREGDDASLFTLSYPEQEFKGKIDRVYNQIDNESKVMNARISIPNPGFKLKPGMMSTVKIAAKSGVNLPVVNSRGIIFDENKNYVLLLDAAGKPKIQEVEIGRKTADKVYISKGLNAGDRIIASRQVFLFESLKN